jgi:Holliday junction resolvasome RuvABC endonuclease subunit
LGNYLYGFDLSMDQSGIVIFDLDTLLPIHIDSFKTKEKETHGRRLLHIWEESKKLKEKYPPKEVAIERGFSRFNVSTQVIYRTHGIINLLFCATKQTYYPPKTVKEAIVRGDATKKRVREVIEKKYPDVVFNNEDESDAFAVALTWLIKNGKIEWEKEIAIKKTRKKKEKVI